MPVHRINVSPRIAAHTLTVRAQSGVPVDSDAPVFTSGATAAAIAENSGAGQVVYTAAATDDSLPVTYSLKSVGDYTAFAINGSTGAVTLTANPDYETQASYSFTVVATDAVGNSSERAVTLAITDADEQAPTLVSAAVNGTSLVLTYSESLATPGPAASAFSVSGATTAAQTPSSAVVSGATVTLTLATTAAYGQTITVNYTVPGTNPIRDAAGNPAAALTAQAVANSTDGPGALFDAGQPGVWYDVSDMSTLFQDAAGTVPVTAVGQPVGRVLDKSGRGNHATQTTATSRPVFGQDGNGKRCLIFDGIDDWLSTAVPVDLSSPSGLSVFASARHLSDSVGMIVESSDNSWNVASNPGTWFMSSRTGADPNGREYGASGTSRLAAAIVTAAIPVTLARSMLASIPGGYVTARAAGYSSYTTSGSMGLGGFAARKLFVGMRNGAANPFAGNVYGVLVIGKVVDGAELTMLDGYFSRIAGLAI